MILIKKKDDMTDLFKAIVENIEYPTNIDEHGQFQMQISLLDY